MPTAFPAPDRKPIHGIFQVSESEFVVKVVTDDSNARTKEAEQVRAGMAPVTHLELAPVYDPSSPLAISCSNGVWSPIEADLGSAEPPSR